MRPLARRVLVVGLVACACGGSNPMSPSGAGSGDLAPGSGSPGTTDAPGSPSSPPPNDSPPPTDVAPVLSVTIVDLSGSYDAGTRRLGSLNCTWVFANDPNDRWCFGAFGAAIAGRSPSPSYDYKVAAGTSVVAATGGTVSRVDAETNPLYPDEFEVETRSPGSSYRIIHDHVKNLRVALGTAVEPGTALGTAGIHTSNRDVYGRVELQVNRIVDAATMRSIQVRPRTLGTDRFNQIHDAALAAHNSANPASAYASVCVVDTLP